MSNTKWYYVCDLEQKKALELTQIPEVWGNITGMADLDDEALADLSWAQLPDRGFLTPEAAQAANIDAATISSALALGTELATQQVREKRDVLLSESDKSVTADRWDSYDEAAKKSIADYRQALRDITDQDPFTATFPVIPDELAYLRAIS